MAEWKECAFGGKSLCHPDAPLRRCAIGVSLGTVNRKDCASCPVPLLVEAVKAANRGLRGLAGYAATHPAMAWPSEANAKVTDALAILPKEPPSG